jgi:hypothetical protein
MYPARCRRAALYAAITAVVWLAGLTPLRAQAPSADPSGWVGRRVVIAVQGSVPVMEGKRVIESDMNRTIRVWRVGQVKGGLAPWR